MLVAWLLLRSLFMDCYIILRMTAKHIRFCKRKIKLYAGFLRWFLWYNI